MLAYDRREQLFLPLCVDDYTAEDSTVRIVDVFVDELNLATLGLPTPLRRVGQAIIRRRCSSSTAAAI